MRVEQIKGTLPICFQSIHPNLQRKLVQNRCFLKLFERHSSRQIRKTKLKIYLIVSPSTFDKMFEISVLFSNKMQV